MHAKTWWIPAALLLTGLGCSSQPQPSPEAARDPAPVYQPIAEAAFLEQYAQTRAFRLGRPARISLTPKGDAVLFLRSGPRSFEQDLWSFDPASGDERLLLSAQMLLAGGQEKLSAEELARRERMRSAARGIAHYELSRDGQRILVPLSDRLYVLERLTGRVIELPAAGGTPIDPRFSPDGGKVALVRDGDLYVVDVEAGSELRLTYRSKATVTNGLAEFVAQEEMDRMEGYWWAPDGGSIAFAEVDAAGLESLHILDAANPFREGYASPYPRAGKKNASVRLGVVPVAGGEPRWIEWDRDRFPYLAKVNWQQNAPLSVLIQNRLQSEQRLLAVDPASGATRNLVTEQDPAWVNIDPSVPRWLPDGSAFLWSTEREGAWQLELRDERGRLIRSLAPPSLGYRSLLQVDAKGGAAWFIASPNPTERQIFRVPLDGSEGPRAITVDPGEHLAVFAGESERYVHTLSSASGEVRTIVRHPDGSPAGELRSVAEQPPFQPNVELLELPGEVSLRAAVVRPRNYQRGLHYPVLLFAYGGPLHQTVTAPKERWLRQQWFADHGFIVVSLDGRGTPGRGRDWERAIHRDLLTLPLRDQVAGLRALAERYPEFDQSRVGVFGWSFGGTFTAMALMRHPETFHAGVAVAPVVDWLDYDTHYTERYLDLPELNPKGYERSSPLHWAKELSRPLLLVHGTADDNVAFNQSLRLSDALFRAGTPHEFLPLAGMTHAVNEPEASVRLYERIVSHFRTRLGAPVLRPRLAE